MQIIRKQRKLVTVRRAARLRSAKLIIAWLGRGHHGWGGILSGSAQVVLRNPGQPPASPAQPSPAQPAQTPVCPPPDCSRRGGSFSVYGNTSGWLEILSASDTCSACAVCRPHPASDNIVTGHNTSHTHRDIAHDNHVSTIR